MHKADNQKDRHTQLSESSETIKAAPHIEEMAQTSKPRVHKANRHSPRSSHQLGACTALSR